MTHVTGIHHVTAISGDPQRNIDFYSGLLGLRLVKCTVNFDDPYTYHFYYGDEVGTPGSLMTFFPWPDAPRGRQGSGQVAVTSFAVVPEAIGFWIERLIRYNVRFQGPSRRDFAAESERVLAFTDHDGLMLEIVGHPGAEQRPAWGGVPGIPREYAIHGFHGITIWVEHRARSERVLVDTLGFHRKAVEGTTTRYTVGDHGPGTIVDVREIGGFGRGAIGTGTVHHVALAVPDDDAQAALRTAVEAARLEPTPVIDRLYFRSVYFREPEGVLYELATRLPGFTIDEPVGHLGESLKLPPQYEPRRAELEAMLPPIHLPAATPAADA